MRNKQKAWRKAAAAMKAHAVAQGKHAHGNRYGKAIRQVTGMMKVKPFLSPLLTALFIKAGIIAVKAPA